MLCPFIWIAVYKAHKCTSSITRQECESLYIRYMDCVTFIHLPDNPCCLLPMFANADTVSHPVNAWKIGRAQAFSIPSDHAISWAAIYRTFSPTPKATNISFSCRVITSDTARTTTSVSPVRRRTVPYPWFAASTVCNNIRVSASSWVIGPRDWLLLEWLETTSEPLVATTSFFSQFLSSQREQTEKEKAHSCFHRSLKTVASLPEGVWLTVDTFLSPYPSCFVFGI